MKHYRKNGLDFVTDLVWQKQSENNKISLKLFREDCKFDFYCKSSSLNSYGFGRLIRDSKGIPIFKTKNLLSLGAYITESVETDKNINLFICFCFDNNKDADVDPTYGYVFLYQGSILPEDGEYIGSLDEVKARIKSLSKLYKARAAFIPDDVPFHNDSPFEYETGLKIYVLKSVIDENTEKLIPASEYIFWRKTRDKVKASRIRSLDNKKQKKILAGVVFTTVLTFVGIFVKSYFFPEQDLNDVTEQVATITSPTSYPSKIFIASCFAKFDKLINTNQNWLMDSFKCTTKGIEVTYKSNNGMIIDLQKMIGESVTYTPTGASLKLKIQLPTELPLEPSIPSLSEQIDSLHNAAEKLGFTVNVNNKKVDITSGYSPLFLYQNNIINELNLSEISMTNSSDNGFMDWRIVGEINAK